MSLYRCIGAAALLAAVIQTGATAQIMRFTTNVGSFDMRLNPTNDPNLQPLVDNIVAYIGLGRYNHSAINRAVEFGPGADDDFVLQMGGFMALIYRSGRGYALILWVSSPGKRSLSS